MLAMAGRFRKLQNLKTLIGNRSYTTATITGSDNNRVKKKVSLYSRISPLGSPSLAMTPELDDWIEKGNKVRFSELKQIIYDLRKRRRFSHALEVSEWMKKQNICEFTSTDHAVQLDLIGKVNGFLEAEKYFNALTDQNKTAKTYGALLHCYVRQRETEKSLAHFQKMKEKNFLSPVTSNDIMSLYIRTHQPEKVHNVLNDMKKIGVAPDNLSYRMCINTYGDKMDIEGMEKILTEMELDPNIIMDWNTYAVVANCYIKGKLIDKANNALKKAEKSLAEKDGLGFNHLISLHARLGNKDDVFRLWGLEKTACKHCINRDYINFIKSLVKLSEFQEAQRVLDEWRSSGNIYDFRVPGVVIDGYLEAGLCDKAKEMLEKLVKEKKETLLESWGDVAVAFLKNGDVAAALSCMETAFLLPFERKMESKVVEKLLNGIGEKASEAEVELFVQKLKKFVGFDRGMYHVLMKGCVKGGKDVGRVVESMKSDGIEEDEETKKILGLHKSKV